MSQKNQTNKPFSSKLLVRILVIFLIILAFSAGYFHALWKTEQKKTQYYKLQLDQLTQEDQSKNQN